MGLNLIYPANLIQFNSMFIGIVMVEVLPIEDIVGYTFDVTETGASNPRMALISLESENFMLNGGTLFLFFIFWFICLLFSYLFKVIALFKKDSPKFKSFSEWIERKLKWNLFFDLFFASQVELLLSAII